jgi:glycosyltransferase involved in cell wall biosynthesis
MAVKPLISICIPTYNGEKYLRQCLDSCISQSFRDFEVIVCDDGSADATSAIAEEYLRKYAFVKFYKNETNIGLVGNWSRCLELASGAWIKFLFQDDVMYPGCLQRFYEHTDKNSDLIVCKRNFILDKKVTDAEKDYYSNQVRTLENTGQYKGSFFTAATISGIAASNISLNFIAEPSLTMFRKTMLNAIGTFDDELKQICDLEFFLRAASNYGLLYIPEQLCGFRIHADSTTEKNIAGGNYRLDYIETLFYALKLLTKAEFKQYRKSLSPLQLFKLKLYVKYKSYLAFKHIATAADKSLYGQLQKKYPQLLFKRHEGPCLRLLEKLKPN